MMIMTMSMIRTAKIRLSLSESKPSGKKRIRYNWNKRLNDNKIKDMYTVEVCNRIPSSTGSTW